LTVEVRSAVDNDNREPFPYQEGDDLHPPSIQRATARSQGSRSASSSGRQPERIFSTFGSIAETVTELLQRLAT